MQSLTNESPKEFITTGTGDKYIDRSATMLSLKVSLKGDIAADTKKK